MLEAFEVLNWAFLEFFAYNGLVAQSVASLLPVKLVQDDPGSNPVDGREEGRLVSVLEQSSKFVIFHVSWPPCVLPLAVRQIIVFCFL